MFKIIIVDDEERARVSIRSIIESNVSGVEIVAMGVDVKSGTELINKHQPDIVLLDINLPDGSGFDIIKNLPKVEFKLIFVTAYEEHALSAFKVSAIDYIVKPIDYAELTAAIEKAKQEIQQINTGKKILNFFDNAAKNNKSDKKIVLKTSESIHIIKIQDIIRCKSDNNYTRFFFEAGNPILVSNTLKNYEEILTPFNFFRTHQSHLINLEHVQRFDKKDGGFIIMSDEKEIPVSNRKKNLLMTIFETY
ncbi:MAG: LytTR family DNA-binding domain-containing protein [Bacteroidota bacterium]|nr:LytTR family DNA-binding domain-containing protein [Bacteroidota bacterium]